MGKYVHVVKKQPEYGNTEAFNWAQEEFKDILRSLGCNVEEQDNVYDEFEVDVKQYERVIEIVSRMIKTPNIKALELSDLFDEDEVYDDEDEFSLELLNLEEVRNMIEGISGCMKNFLKTIKAFYRERDKKSEWIRFSAW